MLGPTVTQMTEPFVYPIGKPRIKVCCISSVAEAELAISCGASALGLVSSMPSGPGVIPEELIAEITASVPPGVATFLLTSAQDVEVIVDQQRRCGVNTIQLCDELTVDELVSLRRALPGVHVVQVVHVVDETAIEQAIASSEAAHALLLDSGNPQKPIKELGGTGRAHDWSISRRVCDAVDIPVFLAGGLNPDNIGDAVRRVRPYGVDVCSGLRSNGHLSSNKLISFVRNIDAAWARRPNKKG